MGVQSQDFQFLVSKDGSKILQGQVFDVSQNPFKSENDKLKTDFEPSLGAPGADVVLVEFSDFQCPYCSRAQPTLRKVRETYGEKVRFVFVDFPLDFHPLAQKAHEAAYCAEDQGKFWPMYDRLFSSEGKLDIANLKAYATELGLDAKAFGTCLDSGKHAERTETAMSEGARNGVTGTPAFFINGRMLVGAQPFESFASVIEDELERAARKQ
jgi:protein-disulfide isomerase